MAEQIRTRAEIPAKYKWDLTHIFQTANDWEKAFQTVEDKISAFADYAGHILRIRKLRFVPILKSTIG